MTCRLQVVNAISNQQLQTLFLYTPVLMINFKHKTPRANAFVCLTVSVIQECKVSGNLWKFPEILRLTTLHHAISNWRSTLKLLPPPSVTRNYTQRAVFLLSMCKVMSIA